jgi:phosphoglycerate dehydrogenase-like enzyme
MENCIVTPHTAGGHSDEHERLVRHFLDNLQFFTTNRPLVDRIM